MKENNIMRVKVILFFLIIPTCFFAQQFLNGSLEGLTTELSELPDYWEIVPLTDLNCQATDSITATPDLTSIEGPIIGNAYKGESFVSGFHFGPVDLIWHEGIMQTVSNFEEGIQYDILFYQAAMHSSICSDTSGSWLVIVNDSIIGISIESRVSFDDDNTDLNWEMRSISFVAFEDELTIKFLPWDDENLDCNDDGYGGLRMGIDEISIAKVTSTKDQNRTADIELIPNPTFGSFKLKISNNKEIDNIEIYDLLGNKLNYKPNINQPIDLLQYHPKGVYIVSIIIKGVRINKKIIKI